MRKGKIYVFLVVLLFSNKLWSLPIWYDFAYDHYSNNESISELLLDFSARVGVPVVISERLVEKVTAKVNGHFKNISAGTFLMKLSSVYQIVWYFDGHILYFYHVDEVETELLHFDYVDTQVIKTTLIELGVWDDRFSWQEIKEKNILFLSGPPRYLELIKELSALVNTDRKEKDKSRYSVKVFPLKYAWAADRVVKFGDKEISVPGIARVVQNILARNTNLMFNQQAAMNRRIANTQHKGGMVAEHGLKGTGMIKSKQQPGEDMLFDEELNHNTITSMEDESERPVSAAYVEANAAQNAVVVHDLVSRMEMYENLIAALDVSSEQIEIEVSVIDINTERLFEFGVNWQSNGKEGAFSFGDPDNIVNTDTGEFNSVSGMNHFFGASGPSEVISLLSSNADYFLGRVQLLEDTGEGQVLSQPSVMTVNNVEAIIDNSTTFYVKLEGEEEVDLVPISAGSILEVIPRVITEKGNRKILLDIKIEDGQVISTESAGSDDLPTVQNSIIKTQALVLEGSSLLVGGHYYDKRSSKVSKVPFLGDIPIVKGLFSSENKERLKMARLFLITPKIVDTEIAQEKPMEIMRKINANKGFSELDYQTPNYSIYD